MLMKLQRRVMAEVQIELNFSFEREWSLVQQNKKLLLRAWRIVLCDSVDGL